MKIISKNKFIAILASLVVTTFAHGQQNSLFNNYSLDLLQINIAQAGLKCTEANLNYRAQWVGVQNAPSAFQLNAQTTLGKSNGLGLRVNSQAQGLFNNLSTTLGYSYRVKLNAANLISLGIGAGWTQNTFNAQKAIVVDLNDANLTANRQIANGFDTEFGAMFKGKKLQIGVSALHLYNTNQRFSNSSGYKLLPQLNTVVGYVFNQGKKIEIEPWVLNRFTVKGNNITEGILNVHYKKTLTVGAGYRSNYGLLGLISLQIKNFRIGYSFDYGRAKNAVTLGSSHQLSAGFSICGKEKVKKEIVIEEPKVEVPKVEEVAIVEIKEVEKPKEVVIEEAKEIEKPIAVVAEKKVNADSLDVARMNQLAELIQFDLNKTELSDNQLNAVNEIAQVLSQNKSLKVIVVGYTCNRGTETLNAKIGDQRAKYVERLLIAQCVNQNQIVKTKGVNGEKALFDNNSEKQAKNRTIRFELLK